jgi:hypothetical protein
MNGDQFGQLTVAMLCLVLVGSGLIARRLDAGTTVRLALIWLAIFAGLAISIRLLGIA